MQSHANQLSLWDEPAPIIWHHHIEVHYYDGSREVVCSADGSKRRRDNSYAGFVGHAHPDECQICNAKQVNRK